MGKKPDDKKGFAGFDSFADEFAVEVPDAPPPSPPETPAGDPPASSQEPPAHANQIFEGKPKRITSNGKWWLWVTVGVAGFIWLCNLSDNNSHPTSTTSGTQYSHPYQAASTTTATPQYGYNPKITAYKKSAELINFDEHKGEIKDFKPVFRKFLQKANNGDADAQYLIGLFNLNGTGTKKNEKDGFLWLFLSAMNGQPGAQYFAGLMMKSEHEGTNMIFKSALQNDSRGQTEIGKAYASGLRGLPQDNEKAFFWLQKAASQGNDDAEIYLGLLYADHTFVRRDDTKAFEWELKSAKQFNKIASAVIAEHYAQGTSVVKQDFGSAYYWLIFAAQDNDNVKKLASVVEANMKFKDYVTAANLGHREVMVKLAQDYHNGNGVPKDNVQALKYIKMHGYSDDKDFYALSAAIQAEMTPEQIKQAEDMSVTWFANMMKDINEQDALLKQQQNATPDYVPSNETKPTPGYTVLSQNEYRWCEYQSVRIKYINHQFPVNEYDTDSVAKGNAQYATRAAADANDALIADDQRSCPNGRNFYDRDEQIIKAELADPATINRLQLDAQKIMKSWNPQFIFRE